MLSTSFSQPKVTRVSVSSQVRSWLLSLPTMSSELTA